MGFGLHFLGILRIGFLEREARFEASSQMVCLWSLRSWVGFCLWLDALHWPTARLYPDIGGQRRIGGAGYNSFGGLCAWPWGAILTGRVIFKQTISYLDLAKTTYANY